MNQKLQDQRNVARREDYEDKIEFLDWYQNMYGETYEFGLPIMGQPRPGLFCRLVKFIRRLL